MQLAVRLKHEAEADVIARAVTASSEGLAREAIADVVHHIGPDRPGMARSDAEGMAPQRRRLGIG